MLHLFFICQNCFTWYPSFILKLSSPLTFYTYHPSEVPNYLSLFITIYIIYLILPTFYTCLSPNIPATYLTTHHLSLSIPPLSLCHPFLVICPLSIISISLLLSCSSSTLIFLNCQSSPTLLNLRLTYLHHWSLTITSPPVTMHIHSFNSAQSLQLSPTLTCLPYISSLKTSFNSIHLPTIPLL